MGSSSLSRKPALNRKVGKAKATKAVADFLFRYMVARYRCVGGAPPSSRIQLTADAKQGIRLFQGNIAADATAWPPVTNDREHEAFFVAIISADDSAIPEIEPAELAAWRNYVLNSGPVPKWRDPRDRGCGNPCRDTGTAATDLRVGIGIE